MEEINNQAKVEEIWKDVREYKGFYQISNLGRVKSLDRFVNSSYGSKQFRHGTIIKPRNDCGYLRIELNKNFKIKYLIHRLVGVAFLPNPNNLPDINHKNSIKTDNRLENLEWIDASGNQIHALKNGKREKCHGEHSNFSKLTKDDVLKIRNLYQTGRYTYKQLGMIFNISKNNIGYIVNNITWKYI